MDISSRREREIAEARLREERDSILKLAVEASPSGMVMVKADDNGSIVMVNATAEKVRPLTIPGMWQILDPELQSFLPFQWVCRRFVVPAIFC